MSNRQNVEQTKCRQPKCRKDKMSTDKMSNRKIGEKEENGERTECRNLKIQK